MASAATEPGELTLHLQVTDADAAWNRAIAAGATEIMPLGDQFWGDRYGQVTDPFGFTLVDRRAGQAGAAGQPATETAA